MNRKFLPKEEDVGLGSKLRSKKFTKYYKANDVMLEERSLN
jgi:hypothetical protein